MAESNDLRVSTCFPSSPKVRQKIVPCYNNLCVLSITLTCSISVVEFILYSCAVWAQIRDDSNTEVDWVLIGYDGNSKTDMTVVDKGNGGMEAVSSKLPEGVPVFGGVRLSSGKFVHFLYIDDNCPAMKRGRTLMYKNGVFNVLEGCHGEIEMSPGLTEASMGQVR